MSYTEKKQYTSKQQEMLYDLARIYGGDDKREFMREIKSLIRYDRMIFKQRMFAAMKSVL